MSRTFAARGACSAFLTILLCAGCMPERFDDAAIDEKIAEAKSAGDCIAVAACVDDCKGDDACKDGCKADATTEARDAFVALESCHKSCAEALSKVAAHPCAQDKGSGACKRECHLGTCRPETMACADNGDTGEGTCLQGGSCLDDCQAGTADSLSCAAGCYRALSEVDQQTLDAQTKCMWGASAKTAGMSQEAATKQMVTTCAGELASCYTGGVSGVSSCAEGLACSDLCTGKSDYDACLAQCGATLNQSAQADFVSFMWCVSALPDSGEFYEKCDWALIACAAPSPGGDTCDQGVGKFGGCMKNNDNTLQCLTTTIASLRPAHAQHFIDFNVCLADKCGSQCKPGSVQAVCTACIKTKCKSQYDKCGLK